MMDTLIEREAVYPEDVHPQSTDACVLRTEALCGVVLLYVICCFRRVAALAGSSLHAASRKREHFAEHLQVHFNAARWNHFQPNVTHLK